MDAIVLVGGLGTRLRTVVADLPKPLAPVNGRPFLDLLLRQLSDFSSVSRVILAVGYKAGQIEERYTNSQEFGFSVEFSLEDSPMGTGGAICLALEKTDSRHVLVMNGDSFVDFELAALEAAHSRHGASITMVVVEVEDTSRFGRVEVDSDDRVMSFSEKGQEQGAGLINAGCYLIDSSILRAEQPRPMSFEREILHRGLHQTFALRTSGRFIDIGVPDSYAAAGEYLK